MRRCILQLLASAGALSLVASANTVEASTRYAVVETMMEGIPIYILHDNTTDAQARIAPSLGDNCYLFGLSVNGEWIELLDPPPAFEAFAKFPIGWGIPLLFPFPSRIRDGRFTFEGEEYTFDKTLETDHSIHGFVWDQPFVVESTTADPEEGAAIVCSLDSRQFPQMGRQFPFPFIIRISYNLRESILTMVTEITNVGDRNMPTAIGLHHYFSVPLSAQSQPANVYITVPADQTWEHEDGLPNGVKLDVTEVNDLRVGGAFTNLREHALYTDFTMVDGVSRCTIEDRDAGISTILESDAAWPDLQLYYPANRPALCLEPYSTPTDGVNIQSTGIDAGLVVLRPGQMWSGTVRVIPQF